jgi:hypothetical protein
MTDRGGASTSRRLRDADLDREDLDPEDIRQLSGTPPPSEQDAVVEPEEIESERELTDTERYEAESEVSPPEDDIADVLLDRDLRDGETDDPNVAAEEGLAYVPPTDPPVIPGDAPDDLEIAAGFGATSLDDPYDDDHLAELLTPESELSAQVREAIRADAATSRYADMVLIASIGGVVLLKGTVEGIEDVDTLMEVASEVDGVIEVRDELEVEGL